MALFFSVAAGRMSATGVAPSKDVPSETPGSRQTRRCRLRNSFVAAWYEGGKDDPKLALLRLDPERAEIWENANSLVAGLKLLMGIDPKRQYRDKVATVGLRH